jgi:hypothetical protein
MLQNLKRTTSSTGYSIGAYLGKAAEPTTWEVGYYYQLTENDSQFGQFMESDFGGGNPTDTKAACSSSATPSRRTGLRTRLYFLNERFVECRRSERLRPLAART